jgi:hypothetical protein
MTGIKARPVSAQVAEVPSVVHEAVLLLLYHLEINQLGHNPVVQEKRMFSALALPSE